MILAFIVGAALAIYFFFIKPKLGKKPNSGNSGSGGVGSTPDPDHSGEVRNVAVKGVPVKFPFEYKTERGLAIGSVVELPQEKRADIFRALEFGVINRVRSFKAKYPHFQLKMDENDLSHTIVALIEPQAENIDKSPALLVHLGKHHKLFTEKHEHGGEIQHSVVRVPAKVSPEQWLNQSKQ